MRLKKDKDTLSHYFKDRESFTTNDVLDFFAQEKEHPFCVSTIPEDRFAVTRTTALTPLLLIGGFSPIRTSSS